MAFRFLLPVTSSIHQSKSSTTLGFHGIPYYLIMFQPLLSLFFKKTETLSIRHCSHF